MTIIERRLSKWLLVLTIIGCICCGIRYKHTHRNVNYPVNRKYLTNSVSKKVDKVVVALVTCTSYVRNHLMLENAMVLIKSIIISAKLYDIPEIDFHIFLEHQEHSKLIADKTSSYACQDCGRPRTTLYFHSAMKVVPKQYRRHMLLNRRYRCTYVRLFLPSALPAIDSIIYLDSDIIVTGDIGSLWRQLYLMDSTQLIAVGRADEHENKNYPNLVPFAFGNLPFVRPKGLNAGMLIMNLTRMREYQWTEKWLSIFRYYGKFEVEEMNDQKVLNILLYYASNLVRILGCEYNFVHIHCSKKFVCRGAKADPVGIHILHGAKQMFEKGGIFRQLWDIYRKFKVDSQDVHKDLVFPIKQAYQRNMSRLSVCYGTLDKYLFKTF